MRAERCGAVLLEVIVAMTILAVGGGAVLALASESTQAVERARAVDRAMMRANGFMEAVSLWSRDDLDRHLGTRDQGAWRMHVGRAIPTLYVVTLSDSTGRVLMSTSLFRPEARHALQ
ncbi:MAG: hypothetical protein ABR543_10745 [Gemmatimonadaceae bacterium]